MLRTPFFRFTTIILYAITLICLFSTAQATTDTPDGTVEDKEDAVSLTPLQQLQNMQQMQSKKNYGLFFVSVSPTNVESLRYYHAYWEGKSYAQLTAMDGTAQDILQKDHTISYFSPTASAFSLQSPHITDKFPTILWANLNDLMENYNIIPMGLYRIAGNLVHSLRIVSKDNFRYQILLFLDAKNQLLLRHDIVDRDNNLLEQFRVVNIVPVFNVKRFVTSLNSIDTPPSLPSQDNTSTQTFPWQAKWLPKGFKLIQQSVDIKENGEETQSQFYSDGLFSFSITLSPSVIKNAPEKSWTQGALTLHTQTRDEQDLTLIGQIPVSTAKRILDDVEIH